MWLQIFEGLKENNVTEEEFLFNLGLQFGILELHRMTLEYEEAESRDPLLDEFLFNKAIRKKIIRFFTFDSRNHGKVRKINSEAEFDYLTEPVSHEYFNEEPLKNFIKTRNVFTDSFDYWAGMSLSDLGFSSDLKLNQNKYYTRVILGFGLAASIAKAQSEGKEKLIEKYLETDLKDLPCPKTDSFVVIPMHFQLIIPRGMKTVHKNDLNIAFTDSQIERMSKFKIISKQEKSHYYFINKPSRFYETLENNTTDEWIKVEWLDKLWSVKIVKFGSEETNATLRLKHGVGYETFLTKREFSSNLRLNPSSKNLYNLQLFETNATDLNNNTELIKTILEKLLEINIISFFTKHSKISMTEIIDSKDKNYLLELNYLAIAYGLFKKRLKSLKAKLGTISHAINVILPEELTTDQFIECAWRICRDSHEEYYDMVKDNYKMQARKDYNAKHHGMSDGFTWNNFLHHFNLSVYAKNNRQLKNKALRMDKRKGLSQAFIEQVFKSQNPSNVVRIEITIRGNDNIFDERYYTLLDDQLTDFKDMAIDLALAYKRLGDKHMKEMKEIEKKYKEKFKKRLIEFSDTSFILEQSKIKEEEEIKEKKLVENSKDPPD